MKLIKLLSLIIASLLIGNVVIANTAVDESVTVKTMSAEIQALTQQNLALKQQIASNGSLTAIANRVEALGFVETPKVMAVTVSSTVALR